MKRSTSLLLRAVAWSSAAAVGIALPMTQAVADHPPTPVSVHDSSADAPDYTPVVKEIYVGDTLAWVWDGSNQEQHTVTSDPLDDEQFDSDTPCEADGRAVERCRIAKSGGTIVFTHRFETAGTFQYYCEVHDSAVQGPFGAVVVKPRREHPSEEPSPSGSPSGSASPGPSETQTEPSEEPTSEEPTERPSEEPTDDPSEEPSEGPTEDDSDEPTQRPTTSVAPSVAPSASASPSPSAPPPTRVGGNFPGGVVFEPAPGEVYTPGSTEAPTVAPPEERPTEELSPFPSAPPLDEPSDLAVDIPGTGRGADRALLAGIAIAGVLLTFAAFSKLVLFAPPWA